MKFEIQRFAAPPPFGLMSAKDKAVIDSLETTYATKDELNSYVRCVKVGNDYNLVNGNGDVIYTIVGKKNPQLTVTPATVEASGKESYAEATISRLGNGALSIIAGDTDSYVVHINDYDEVIFRTYGAGMGIESVTETYTIAVAETDEYESATAMWTVTGVRI